MAAATPARWALRRQTFRIRSRRSAATSLAAAPARQALISSGRRSSQIRHARRRERLSSPEGSRALTATRVRRRPRRREPRQRPSSHARAQMAAEPAAGQVGPLGLPALACRHVIQPHWVPQGDCESKPLSVHTECAQVLLCTALAADVRGCLALPPGPLILRVARSAAGGRALCGRRGTSVCHQQRCMMLCMTANKEDPCRNFLSFAACPPADVLTAVDAPSMEQRSSVCSWSAASGPRTWTAAAQAVRCNGRCKVRFCCHGMRSAATSYREHAWMAQNGLLIWRAAGQRRGFCLAPKQTWLP